MGHIINNMASKRLIIRQARFIALLLAPLLLVAYGPAPAARSLPAAPPPAGLSPDALQLVSEEHGFLAMGGRLYRTETGGERWDEITPAEGAVIAAYFTDPNTGWVVLAPGPVAPYSAGALRLAVTRDGGQSWEALNAGLPGSASDAPVAQVHLFFVSPEDGWLVWRFAGSSNFREGALFRTRDGGRTWARLAVPFGEPVVFTDALRGRIAGGLAGDGFYETADGGESWTRAGAPSPPGSETYRPDLRGSGVAFAIAPSDDPQEAGRVAWRVQAEGVCDENSCRQETHLLRTEDGGRTWAQLPWPEGFGAAQMSPVAPRRLFRSGETDLFDGQGFDKCEIAAASQLATWITESPYRAVNLYFGGSSRSCPNRALSASFLRTLRAQGWVFIPTWVGPQAPCTDFNVRMSADPAIAYQQGQAEANAAIERAVELELANEDGSGTVIYYDLEYFAASNAACLLATQAFLTGWTGRIKAAGSLAGVYSTGCVLNGQSGNVPPPDAVWVANWAYSSYTPGVSVWNLYCLSNTLWPNHQRLRQYTGGHSETWGGVTLNIDSNVLDGPVALLRPSPSPTSTPTPTPTATPTATSTATPTATATSTATLTPTVTSPRQSLWLPLIHR
jgi:photosystem II stability/assembly factor-like uncharacterized protein